MRHAKDARPQLGAVLVVFAAACFAALDTTVRFAGAGLPVLQPADAVARHRACGVASAVLLSWLVLRQLPDFWGWTGIAVIAVCGAAGAALNLRDGAAQRTIEPCLNTSKSTPTTRSRGC